MIIGAHITISSRDNAADKAFLQNVLKLPFVDAGGGYLIFAGGPAEFAVHETGEGGTELYLMCKNIGKFVAAMDKKGAACGPLREASYGTLTEVTLPSGGKIGVYQPRHKRPKAAARKQVRRPAKPASIRAKRVTKKKAKSAKKR